MKKNLLVLAAMAAFSLGATAENVGDTISTTALKYRVTSANTVEVLGGSIARPHPTPYHQR